MWAATCVLSPPTARRPAGHSHSGGSLRDGAITTLQVQCPQPPSLSPRRPQSLSPRRPTPLTLQSSAWSCAGLDARTTRCCMSLHVRKGLGMEEHESGGSCGPRRGRGNPPHITYLASRARAIMPAASGADAEVPVCLSVQWWCRSVVTWGHSRLGYWSAGHFSSPSPGPKAGDPDIQRNPRDAPHQGEAGGGGLQEGQTEFTRGTKVR